MDQGNPKSLGLDDWIAQRLHMPSSKAEMRRFLKDECLDGNVEVDPILLESATDVVGKACSFKNFATLLLKMFKTKEELKGVNVNGVLGKKPLEKNIIYTLTKRFYPREMEVNGWQQVVDALNEYCRRPTSKAKSIRL